VAIDVELFGQLAPHMPRRQTLTVERPTTASQTTAQELAVQLGLELDDIGLMSINGVQVELQELVPPDCRLCLFPPMSGG
jgi:molybdopterin converting factor small subunit